MEPMGASLSPINNPVKKDKKPKPDDKEQSQRFVETAKQLESDESGKSFEKALENIKVSEFPKSSDESH